MEIGLYRLFLPLKVLWFCPRLHGATWAHNSLKKYKEFIEKHWRRKWQLTPVFLPRESMDRGAWWATVHGMVKSRTQLKQLSIERHCIIYVLVSKTICGFHNLERKYIMDLSLHSFIQYFFTQLWRYIMILDIYIPLNRLCFNLSFISIINSVLQIGKVFTL